GGGLGGRGGGGGGGWEWGGGVECGEVAGWVGDSCGVGGQFKVGEDGNWDFGV
ncbi:hypothetical protein JMA02_14685, partial [Acinetobacter baumannii]|nr:hypothetical protein [Acinetobacter baumannii]